MKKLFLILSSLLFLSTGLFAQIATDLNVALSGSARDISNALPVKANVAVVQFFSDTEELSNYIASQMIKGISNAGLQKVLERDPKKMALVDAEQGYQYSGAVSDSSMVEIGYKLGAQYLVYGTFDQLGGMYQLSIQATNVETAEILYYQSYTIQSSSTVTKLLGDKMELVNLSDFLEAIARCDRKISALEANKNSAVDNGSGAIMTKYAAEIQAVYQIEKEPWESTAEYDDKIKAKVNAIVKKRDGEISAVKSAATPKYDQQINAVEAQKQQILTDLKNTTFILKGASIQTFMGDFDAEAKPKNWPLSVKSLDKNVSYIYNGKYVANDADVKTEYKTVEDARKKKDLAGEIRYKVIQDTVNPSSFDVYIDSVRLSIASTGAVLVNENVKKVSGSIDAAKIVDGGNTKKAPEKSNVVAPKATTTAPAKPATTTTPAKTTTTAPAKKLPHPRTYIVDPVDYTYSWYLTYNKWGKNFQSNVALQLGFVKDNKPQAGDTIKIRGKFVSDIDIPVLNFGFVITDNGNWSDLTDWSEIKNVKAGKPVVITKDLKMKANVENGLTLVFNYGANIQNASDGKTATLKFERVEKSGDVTDIEGSTIIEVQKIADLLKIDRNYAWTENGQDRSKVTNYQAIIDVTSQFKGKLPKKGDKVCIKWKGQSDLDIKNLRCRLVDNTEAANWWKELTDNDYGAIIISSIKAGQTFEISPKVFELTQNPAGGVYLCVNISLEDVSGPVTIKAVK